MKENRQPCKYCGTQLLGYEKDAATNRWINYKLDGTVHEFKECKAIQANKNKPPEGQAQLPTNQGKVVYSETGINLNTVFNVVSENRKTITELKKMVQTLQELVDAQSQQITLILKQTGYPKPETITNRHVCDVCGKGFNIEAVNSHGNTYCADCWNKQQEGSPKEEIKPSLEELHNQEVAVQYKEEVIDPMRVQKEPDKVVEVEGKRYEVHNIEHEEGLEPEFTRGWKPISERFECASCEGDKHNGFENYAGTKLCDTCKEGIDAHNY